MARFTTESIAPAAPDAVFNFIVDLSQWSSFPGHGRLPGIESAQTEDGGPVGMGSRIKVRNKDGTSHTECIAEFNRPGRICLRFELQPPASRLMREVYEEVTIEPVGDGHSKVTRTFTMRPRSIFTAPIVSWIAKPMMRAAIRSHNEIVAQRLGGATPTHNQP